MRSRLLTVCVCSALAAAALAPGWPWLAAGLALFPGSAAFAQQLEPVTSLQFDLPAGSPLEVVSTDLGDSSKQVRGGAMVLDLHALVTFRNQGGQNVRGVTLVMLAQEMTPGGKASVAVPSLNVRPGQTFPVRINLRLLRPLPAPPGPLVRAGLDGVLFADYSFVGPNRLDSRRTLTAYEMEAQRDREFFRSAVAKNGPEGLRQEVLASLARQSKPRLDVQVSRNGGAPPARALSAAVSALVSHSVNFAFLKIPDAPLDPLAGAAQVNGSEASSPRVEVINRSSRPVRSFEVGWIISSSDGRQFLAGSISSPSSVELAPRARSVAVEDRSYKFSVPGQAPPAISEMQGYVSQVEFADGKIWVPSRQALESRLLSGSGSLLDVVPVSAEEQRLTQLYRTRGLQALIDELNKF